MAKVKPGGGPSLTNKDASIVLGMVARGDREHDIACWFGVNQGRIAEVKDGSHGSLAMAPAGDLPPKGHPGVKGRKLKFSVEKALAAPSWKEAQGILVEALKRYDADEA